MIYSDWIQLSLAFLTLAGLITVWVLPVRQRQIAKENQSDRIRKRVTLYLDVLEIKLEMELGFLQRGRGSQVKAGEFEGNNQRNYNALENALQEADVLGRSEYNHLLDFVRNFKVSDNIRSESDVTDFLSRIRDPELRRIFPQGCDLGRSVDRVRGRSQKQ